MTEWWEYGLALLIMFFACVTLNYFVKRMNEARFEGRLIRSQQSPTSQSTQVQGPLIEIETKGSVGKVDPTSQMKEKDKVCNETAESTTSKYLGAIYNIEVLNSKHLIPTNN